MQVYHNNMPQAMLSSQQQHHQQQGPVMAQHPTHMVNPYVFAQTGQPQYGAFPQTPQPLMVPHHYAMVTQSQPTVASQRNSVQQPVQQHLRGPASVVSEPPRPSLQRRPSILSTPRSLNGGKSMTNMRSRSQIPTTRKSVTINLKPEINSGTCDSDQAGSSSSTTEMHSPELIPNKSIRSNPPQVDSSGQVGQHNNSGQNCPPSSRYMHFTGRLHTPVNGYLPVPHPTPAAAPLITQENLSNQGPRNQQTLSINNETVSTEKDMSTEKFVAEELAELESTSEGLLDVGKQGTEPGGDSQSSGIIDPVHQIKMLKTKQTVMECVMRKLLRSMKQIQEADPNQRNKAESEAEHRLKMARMMQLLMLQRKNLQQQADILTESYDSLLQKHECLKTYSEGCVAENLDLNKKCHKLQTERDSKDSQIKALMQLSCKLQKKLESHAHTEMALENTALEVKRLVCDNENLKSANQQLEATFKENTKERESLSLQNSQLKLDLDRVKVELANQRIRTEKVTAENAALRNQLSQAEAGSKNAAKKSVEYGQLKEAYENLQFDHQRLQMLYISETETRRDLHNQLQELNGNIRVISRFRPPESSVDYVDSPFEFCAMDKIFIGGKAIPTTMSYQRQLGYNQPQAYTARDEFFSFNRVFQDTATQADIFEEVKPIIGSFVDGYNVCILAYGPTGSGKTYTMQGTKTHPGLCRRAITEIFALCDPLQGAWCIEINIAMFEIHNEVIYDLLAPQITPIKLCDNGSDVRLVNAEEKITTSEPETLHWIEKGFVRRKVSSTRLNSESSRSHLIIRMHLTLVSTIDNQRRTSSLVLCDLAGSESAERIEANEMLHMETGFINRSLVTLARVFETLRRKSGQCASTGLAIPYRDSKLTHLLKPCLGGQAKCVLIVTASPEQKHLDRTLKALEFAQRAMQVSLGRPAKNNRILVSNQTPRT